MAKDGTTKGPRVTTPEGVFPLTPKRSRKIPIPSPVVLLKAFQEALSGMTDTDRSVVTSLLEVIKNARYITMLWESQGSEVTIHRASQDMPTVHFPVIHKQCGEVLNELRTGADQAELAEKTKGRGNGQRHIDK